MSAIPTLAVLFAFMLLRPHEAVDSLKSLPFNPIAAAVIVSYLLDLRVKASSFRPSPLLGLAFAFFVVCALSIVLKAGDRVGFLIPGVGASFIAFFVVSHGLRSFRAIEAAAAVLLTITILLAAFGVHQG
ncbi:MAG TPA: hypothetical protein VHU40_18120, partial [Polyangia bacterium]|nr:hypothetical protein [Polyangia bacterium]